MRKVEKHDRATSATPGKGDPVLLMLGVGKQLWQAESGDRFIERLRREDVAAFPIANAEESRSAKGLADAAWSRIERHQAEEFHTVRGLPFTYQVEGSGIWFRRNGRRVGRRLTRTQVEIAISRCPLTNAAKIHDLIAPAYLFALLMDPRIRMKSW
jgi:hypothetical protein